MYIYNYTKEEEYYPELADILGVHKSRQQAIYRYPNGYGASIVKGFPLLHNHWELAVLKLGEDGEFYICYDTDITDDVVVIIYDHVIKDYLEAISKL